MSRNQAAEIHIGGLHHPPREDVDTTRMMRRSHRASMEESMLMSKEDGMASSNKSWLMEKVIGQEKEIEVLRIEMKRLQNVVGSASHIDRTLHTTKEDNQLLMNQNIKSVKSLSVSNENNLDKTDGISDLDNAHISGSENNCAKGRLPRLQHDAGGIELSHFKEAENHESDSQCEKQDVVRGKAFDEKDPLNITCGKVINVKTENGSADFEEDDGFEQLCVSIGVGTYGLDWKEIKGTIKVENAQLRRQLEEILKVNNSWDSFWSRKKSNYESILKEKEELIDKLRDAEADALRRLKTANAGKEQALKDKDEMLLLTKARILKLEEIIDKLQKDLAESNQKTERAQKFARGLLQQRKDQEVEIKRLNKILETNAKQQQTIKAEADKLPQNNTGTSSPQPKSPAKPIRDKSSSRKIKRSDHSSKDSKIKKDTRTKVATHAVEVQASGRRDKCAQQKEMGNDQVDGVSLTKEELKEKLVFLKEQTDAYESDFRKERNDRERAVGQLEHVKGKLDRTRQKLSQSKHRNPTPCGHCTHMICKQHCIIHL